MHALAHSAINGNPIFGIFQPGHGMNREISWIAMKKAAKNPRPPRNPGVMRRVMGDNLKGLINARLRDLPNDTARVKKVAKDAKIGHGTVQRAMDGQVSTTLDVIERIALALEISVYQLMLPNLDVDNPQVVPGAMRQELEFYAHLKRQALERDAGAMKPALRKKKEKDGVKEN